MTNEQLVSVVLRAIGVWWILQSLSFAVSVVPIVPSYNYTAFIGGMISLAVGLPLGACLALLPLRIAKLLMPKVSPGDRTTAWSLEEFQAVLFGALGMYLLVTTLTNLSEMVRAFASIENGGLQTSFLTRVSALATIALKVAAGIWLLLGARGLRGAIKKLKALGS